MEEIMINKWRNLPFFASDGQSGGGFMTLNETNYVDEAEAVIKNLEKDNKGNYRLTTTQIRKILTQVSSIYDRVNSVSDVNELIGDFAYLRVQIAYQAGRDISDNGKKGVDDFVKKSKILDKHAYVMWVMENEPNNIELIKTELILFCRYMEALVAYFKYYGGKDS
jgi:CRISPR-associated protein Csm2